MGIMNKLPFDFRVFLQNKSGMVCGTFALLFASVYFFVRGSMIFSVMNLIHHHLPCTTKNEQKLYFYGNQNEQREIRFIFFLPS